MKISMGELRTMVREEINKINEKKNFLQDLDPDHEGYCTPMSKPTCTPQRKALARRFKKGGDINKANLKRGKNPEGKG